MSQTVNPRKEGLVVPHKEQGRDVSLGPYHGKKHVRAR